MRRTTSAISLAACLAGLPSPSTAADAATVPITVATMGPVAPGTAPGHALYLVRYEIQPGAQLPLHHHEGTQFGFVAPGELTYHVAEGEVPVYRKGADGKPILDRTLGAGDTGMIAAGEWLVEEPDDHHWGANRGDVPLVIFTSALLREGAPLATRDPP